MSTAEPRTFTAYQAFFKKTLAEIKGKMLKSLKSGEKWGSAHQNAAVKEVGARWRSLSDAQKQKFADSKLTTIPTATGKRKAVQPALADDDEAFKRPRCSGKVVLVTGGTQGLGEAIALLLAREGCVGICICGRNAANGKRVVDALEALGTEALYVQADLSDAGACADVVQQADARFGRIDGLVNCAAATTRSSWEEATVEHMDFIYRLNFRAPFLLTQAVYKIMKREGGGGSIVNIGSVNGHGGISILPMYSSMKGAMNTMTKNAAFAFRHDRVRVNCIAVGWMATPAEHEVMTKYHAKPSTWLRDADAAHPMGRILRPRDIAKMAVHLLSDDAEMQTASVVDIHEQHMGCWD